LSQTERNSSDRAPMARARMRDDSHRCPPQDHWTSPTAFGRRTLATYIKL